MSELCFECLIKNGCSWEYAAYGSCLREQCENKPNCPPKIR